MSLFEASCNVSRTHGREDLGGAPSHPAASTHDRYGIEHRDYTENALRFETQRPAGRDRVVVEPVDHDVHLIAVLAAGNEPALGRRPAADGRRGTGGETGQVQVIPP